jgi:hypothetical protein
MTVFMSEIRGQLAQELAEVEWGEIIPHAKRDAVIVVAPTLDLLDVGEAIANDNVSLVQQWIAQALIHKPSSEELQLWNEQPTQIFNTLIVQPFVLVSY